MAIMFASCVKLNIARVCSLTPAHRTCDVAAEVRDVSWDYPVSDATMIRMSESGRVNLVPVRVLPIEAFCDSSGQ